MRSKLIFTDDMFPMDGVITRLDKIRTICDEFGALLGIDECHAMGFLGKRSRGSHEYRDVFGKVDITTDTLGKGLGGTSGGFMSARGEVVALLRQRLQSYLFPNTVAPYAVGTAIKVLDLLGTDTALRNKLEDSALYFRHKIAELGFDTKPGGHSIAPIMMYDAQRAQTLSKRLLELGVYMVSFFYPVAPKGQARTRIQISAMHEHAQLDTALKAFEAADRELGII